MTDTNARYKRYLLTVLVVILAFNFVDRLALGLVLEDIKVDLDLSDTELGFLSGIAFALFYSVMGIPIARWADRGNRVTIISVTAVLWSLMVALSGSATSFLQLLVIRTGVAVGEAGCIPPAHSLIADYFSRAERPRAAAIYMLGIPLSMFIGYFVAGWLNEFYGWRTTFVLLGLPGFALAALVWFTVREPRREQHGMRGPFDGMVGARALAEVDSAGAGTASLLVVCRVLWRNATFRHLLFCFSVLHFFGYGILQWQPTFFIRSYGIETGALGTWFALIYGVGGFLGTYWGGRLATRHAANNERLQLRTMAMAYVVLGAMSVLIYSTDEKYLALALLAVFAVGFYSTSGPLLATVQTLVPERMRATAIALIYLFANLIGMGLGPLATGALSDLFQPWAGQESLRYALLALSPGYAWVAWHLHRASQTVIQDIEAVQMHPGGVRESKTAA